MQTRPAYTYFETTVCKVQDVTPRMRRVTLTGDALANFQSDHPGQWVKLFFGDGDKGRAFTIREWRPEQREMVIDFVRHEAGLAGAWIASAKPGLAVRIAGPRSDFRYLEGRTLYLFGDETALPAISAIAEAMPANSRTIAVIEVAEEAAKQTVLTTANVEWCWLVNLTGRPSSMLSAFAQNIIISPEAAQVWIGCECSAARELRCGFSKLGFDKHALHASGYWKMGAVEHVDQDSDY